MTRWLPILALAFGCHSTAADSLNNPSVGDAPIVVEVFTSRDCDRCFAFHREVLQSYEASPLKGRVRFVVRDIANSNGFDPDPDVALFCTQVFADWLPARTILWRAGNRSSPTGTPVELRHFERCRRNPVALQVLRFNYSSFIQNKFRGTPAFLARSSASASPITLHGFQSAADFVETITALLK